MNERFNLSAWTLTHRSFVSYLILLIIAAGTWSFFHIGRSEDPPYKLKTMIVQAFWPGATVIETLEQLTDRLERKLQELPHLDNIRSYTTGGRSTLLITVQQEAHRIIPELWYQVRKKVDDIRLDLPQGVIGPGLNDEFGDTFGIVYAFSTDRFSFRELRDYVDQVRSQLLQIPDVSKIETVGEQEERIYLEFSVEQLSGLSIDPSTLIKALQAQNAVTPPGVVETKDDKLLIRTTGAFESEQNIREVNFAVNGRMIRLTDIATVKRGYADPPQPLFRVNGRAAIGLSIAMRAGGNILTLGNNVQGAMSRITADLPTGIEVKLVADQPLMVKHAVNEFLEALWEAVAIVLAVSFLSLGFRAGAVVAFSIPIVLAVVFTVMYAAGIDFQRVSLGALIIALGLLVDDAMITTETMVSRLEGGDNKTSAATYAYNTTAFPMLTGTLVTICGFVPIGFAQSDAGEYTFSLFAVVSIALITSWFVAVLFAPLFGVAILPSKFKRHSDKPSRGRIVFRAILAHAMRWRWLTIASTIALFGLSIYGLLLVPQQFFPPSDRPELVVDLKLPEGSSMYATDLATAQVDELLRGDEDVERWTTYSGRGAMRFYLSFNVQLTNDFFGQVLIVTKSFEARERLRTRLEAALNDRLPAAVVRIYPLSIGLPGDWPLQYRVSGPDVEKVRHIAYRVAQAVSTNPYVRNTSFDWIEPARTIRVGVDQDQARALGLSSDAVAQLLRFVMTGATITQVRDRKYLIDVVVRANDEDRASLSTMRTMQVPLPSGRSVPLSQVASIEPGLEYPLIWRRDRVPTITVLSDLADGILPHAASAALMPKIAEIQATLSPNYLVVAGGETEESVRSLKSIAAVVPLMLFLTFTILMIQLQSFQLLFLVLSVAPLGLIGVVAALLITNKPLGFVAILGVIALIGMIARNSVILVDQIQIEIKRGTSPWDGVINATAHRLRPILLTSAAAILGLVPIAPTVFWGPLAYAIMGGLAAATLLTLIFLPALYVAWFGIREDQAPGEAG
jgi:multidrug efflux pump subunit AcrB